MSEPADPGHAPDEWTLMAYAEGRLDAGSARGREITTWLLTHPRARQHVDEYARQDREIRAAFASKFAEPVPARLQPAAIRQRQRRERLRWAGVAATVAAAAGLLLLQPAAQRAPAGKLDGFAQDVLQQIESGSPAQQIETVMAQPVQMFMPAGFELTGERQLQASGGVLTEQHYRDAAGRGLRLFIGEEPREPAIEPQWLRAEGLHVVYWEAGGRHYALSGEIGRTELQQLAAQVMQAPADDLQLAGDAATATTLESVSATAFEPLSLPDAAQPASTVPTLGIDPHGQIEVQPQLVEQPML